MDFLRPLIHPAALRRLLKIARVPYYDLARKPRTGAVDSRTSLTKIPAFKGLSRRVKNALAAKKISTVHQLTSYSEERLAQAVPGLGRKSIGEIKDFLHLIGYRLAIRRERAPL